MRRKTGKPDKPVPLLQAAVSFIFYGADILLMFFPCIVIGDGRYNLFQLAFKLKNPGLEALIDGLNVYADRGNLGAVKVVAVTELVLFGIFFLCGIAYLASVLAGRRRKLNLAAFCASFAAYYLHMSMNQYSIMDITTDRTLNGTVLGIIVLFSGLEFMTVKIMGIWKETRRLADESRRKDQLEKEERQQRLAFDGRYNELFYRFV